MESLSQVFDVLSKERRRYALYALDQAHEPVEIQDLANRVREWETNDGVSTEEFDDVVLSLYHTHLPKAAQAEYIEYDRAKNEIRITGTSTEFQIILHVSKAIEQAEQEIFDPDTTTPAQFLDQLTSTKS